MAYGDIPVRHPGTGFNEAEVARGGFHLGGHGPTSFAVDHILPIMSINSHLLTASDGTGQNAPSTLHYMYGGHSDL